MGFSPLTPSSPKPAQAEAVRLLLAAWKEGRDLDPWLEFPQDACSFSFGSAEQPLPIGALRVLWSAGRPFVQACPGCGGEAYIVSFGGLLSMGGGNLVCATCDGGWFQFMGGLARVRSIMQASALERTEFRIRGARFGGAFRSDGAELRRVLGVRQEYQSREEVRIEFEGGQRFQVDLDASKRESL